MPGGIRGATPAGARRWDSDGGPTKSKVTLHIYDVVGHALVRNVNCIFRALGTGAFHTGVEVYGQEWSYGFSDQRHSGVFCCTPKSCNVHTYREAVEMGQTTLSPGEIKTLIEEMARAWPGTEYDLLRRNCCHFTDELCRRLGTGPLPYWVTNLASAGASLIDNGLDFRISLGVLRSLHGPAALAAPDNAPAALPAPDAERKDLEEEGPRAARPWRADRDMEVRKWEEMLAVGIPMFMRHHPVTFQRRLHRGVPPTLRWQIWKDACGYDWRGPVEQYDELCGDSQWSPLIALDIGRTFSELPEFGESRQQSLRRVLNAYANHSPTVGYCQGMNFIAGLLLLVSGSERETFGVFVRLMDHDGLAGFYREDMPLLRTYVKACDRLVAEQLPELREHFLRESVPLALYLHQWFLTLFIKSFPLATVLVLWDVIICGGLPGILTIAVTILRVLKDGLLNLQFEEINSIFKAMKEQKSGEFLSYRIGQLLMRESTAVGLPEHIQEYLRSKPEAEAREGPLEDDEDEEHWSALAARHDTPRRRRPGATRKHRLAASAARQAPQEKCDWAERGCTLAERELACLVLDDLKIETLEPEPDPVARNLAAALAAAGVCLDDASLSADDALYLGVAPRA
mmetsp:Transcript_63644/g.165430  ORF Transcript_63644/g.165430 Transcript_63644/m.165430 type:complete len:628 (+) Transcript_63644:33-1916(+)